MTIPRNRYGFFAIPAKRPIIGLAPAFEENSVFKIPWSDAQPG